MAIAGTPDGKQKYDPEMAAAYLRLVAYTEAPDKNAPDYLPKASTCHELEMKKLLEAQASVRNPTRKAIWLWVTVVYPYSRRNNWAAVVRGHSRYLWAAEHYLPANFYGRYLAHGSMQILPENPMKWLLLPPVAGRRPVSTGIVFRVSRAFICLSTSCVPGY